MIPLPGAPTIRFVSRQVDPGYSKIVDLEVREITGTRTLMVTEDARLLNRFGPLRA